MLRDFDGFDSYPTADLPYNFNIVDGSWQIVPAAGRFGSGAIRNQVTGGGEIASRFYDDQPTWIIGFAYKFSVAGYPNVIASIDYGGSGQVDLRMNSSNILVITRNGTVIGTGTTALLTNTFYFLEFKVTIASSISAHTCVAKIGGTVEIDVAATTNTDAQSSGKANRISLHFDNFHIQNTFDDLYICDGTGSAGNDFLGDMRVEDLRPTGSGFYSDFTLVGAGTHYGAINEASEDGDTSYLHSSTIGNKETFTFPSLSSAPTAIAGIKFVSVARKDDAGVRAITPLIRHSGTNYLLTEQPLPDSYSYLSQIVTTNPATSAAWTGAEVNAIEAGTTLTA